MVAKKKKGAAPEQAPQEGWGDPPTASSPPADDWGESDLNPAGSDAQSPAEEALPSVAVRVKRKRAGEPVPPPPETPKEKGGNTHPLVSFVERYERLEEEKSALAEDMKELMGEIKSQSYSSAALRKVIQRRKQNQDKLAELETLIDEYERILR